VIHVEPKELGPEWDEWKKKAAVKAKKLIDDAIQRRKPEFKNKIWKELKPFLEKLFHNKCAYCESNYTAVTPADVDHYRPKSGVEEDKIHPGYYWLAYDYHNLLPTCPLCNRCGGKTSRFPIKGKRAMRPEDSLDAEKPLLLNPYTDKNIEAHITFGIKGIIVGKTDRGLKTIEICMLDRETLQTKRQKLWEWEQKRLFRLFRDMVEKNKIPEDDALGNIITPDIEYSAYIRESLIRYYKKKKQVAKHPA